MNALLILAQAQAPPPNTLDGMLIGYGILGALALGYVISLVLRARRLHQDIEVLKQLQEDDSALN